MPDNKQYWLLPTHEEKLLGWWEVKRQTMLSAFQEHLINEKWATLDYPPTARVPFDCGAGLQYLEFNAQTLKVEASYYDENGDEINIELE